jgi:hypothetical protein
MVLFPYRGAYEEANEISRLIEMAGEIPFSAENKHTWKGLIRPKTIVVLAQGTIDEMVKPAHPKLAITLKSWFEEESFAERFPNFGIPLLNAAEDVEM